MNIEFKLLILRVVFWGSYLVFPALIAVAILLWRRKLKVWLGVLMMILLFLFSYARFIEPRLITVDKEIISTADKPQYANLSGLKLAIISDIHLGVFKQEDYLEEVVEAIREESPDLVLIPGDFLYGVGGISSYDLNWLVSPLGAIEAPVFAVLGNHDSGKTGELDHQFLKHALEPYIRVVDNQAVELEVYQGGEFILDKGSAELYSSYIFDDPNYLEQFYEGEFRLVGLADIWAEEADFDLLKQLDSGETVVVLTHNPDTAYLIGAAVESEREGKADYSDKVDLVVSGHTHGGQIRIPWIYKLVIPTDWDFDDGWYEVLGMEVFVTTGVGEIGLPMRLGVPPVVDILEFN